MSKLMQCNSTTLAVTNLLYIDYKVNDETHTHSVQRKSVSRVQAHGSAYQMSLQAAVFYHLARLRDT